MRIYSEFYGGGGSTVTPSNKPDDINKYFNLSFKKKFGWRACVLNKRQLTDKWSMEYLRDHGFKCVASFQNNNDIAHNWLFLFMTRGVSKKHVDFTSYILEHDGVGTQPTGWCKIDTTEPGYIPHMEVVFNCCGLFAVDNNAEWDLHEDEYEKAFLFSAGGDQYAPNHTKIPLLYPYFLLVPWCGEYPHVNLAKEIINGDL